MIPRVEIFYIRIEGTRRIKYRHVIKLWPDIVCIVTGRVCGQMRLTIIVARMLHIQWREDVLLQKGDVRLPTDALDNIAQKNIARVAIAPLFTGRKSQRTVLEACDQL